MRDRGHHRRSGSGERSAGRQQLSPGGGRSRPGGGRSRSPPRPSGRGSSRSPGRRGSYGRRDSPGVRGGHVSDGGRGRDKTSPGLASKNRRSTERSNPSSHHRKSSSERPQHSRSYEATQGTGGGFPRDRDLRREIDDRRSGGSTNQQPRSGGRDELPKDDRRSERGHSRGQMGPSSSKHDWERSPAGSRVQEEWQPRSRPPTKLSGANSVEVGRDLGHNQESRGLRRDRPGRRGSRSRSPRERLLPPQVHQHNSGGGAGGRRSPRQRVPERDEGRPSRETNEVEAPSETQELPEEETCGNEEEEVKEPIEEEGEVLDEPAAKKQRIDGEEENEDGVGAEDFSDIGESDDEILTKDNLPEEEEGLDGETGETSSRRSSGVKSKSENELLEGISDEDLEDMSADEEESKTKAKMADALGVGTDLFLYLNRIYPLYLFLKCAQVDWSELMTRRDEVASNGVESDTLKKKWSMASILNRVGLSEEGMGGKECYDDFVSKVNQEIEGKR